MEGNEEACVEANDMVGEDKEEGGSSQKLPPAEWRSLSHKQRRSYVNKMRRKYRRMRAAEQRKAEQEAMEAEPGYLEKVCEEERRVAERLRQEEAKSMLENAAWLRREMEAQEEFRKMRELQEKRKIEKEERERLIREEWEALQEKEREETRAKEREKEEKEERLREALSIGDRPPVSESQPWHNPIAPEDYNANKNGSSQDLGTEKDSRNCSFFLKTGACRFGDRCSRKHPRLTSSRTLMIPSMYSSLGFQEQVLNERDQDVALEYEDREMYEDFKNFYNDVLPEFSKAGKVVQFKVSRNYEAHLRGNVYVQYLTEEECARAFQMFNGRWYAQKQLSCVYCPVTKWRSAICGLYNQKRCPKGRNCNFLHVFPNPTGAFFRADRDLPPLSPPHVQETPLSLRLPSPSHHRSSTHQHSRNGQRSKRASRSKSPPINRRRRRRQRRSRTRSKSREGSHHRRRRLRSKSRVRTHSSRRSRSKSRDRTRSRRSRSRSSERLSHSRRHWRHHRSSSRDSRSSTTPPSRCSSRSASSDREWQRRHKRKKKKRKKDERSKKRHRHRSSRERVSDTDCRGHVTKHVEGEEVGDCTSDSIKVGESEAAEERTDPVLAASQAEAGMQDSCLDPTTGGIKVGKSEAAEERTDPALAASQDEAGMQDSCLDPTTSLCQGNGGCPEGKIVGSGLPTYQDLNITTL